MKRFIAGEERSQSTLFPERLDDYAGADSPVGVVDVFVDELDPGGSGFDRVAPQSTGRPGYHPSVLLKLYIYGYLNRVQWSPRLLPYFLLQNHLSRYNYLRIFSGIPARPDGFL